MIDFPMTHLLDDNSCTNWLERHLHPEGLKCPHCGSLERRLFRQRAHFHAYRCRVWDGYYTLLTATVFAKAHQPPATLVLLLRGIAKGESTARLAYELRISCKQPHTLRRRLQTNLHVSAPTTVMSGTVFEADELYQNSGKKGSPHLDPTDLPRRRAHQRRGHGTYANDRPPLVSIISRDAGEQRFWVGDHADRHTCAALIAENIPAPSTQLYTNEWQSYRRSHPSHATVRHGVHEWARDDDGDGCREVHGKYLRGSRRGTADLSAWFSGRSQARPASLRRDL
jgi:predicted RNA-binding Zn-ribbon protein involved in translation (DUF1610 family)